MVIKALLSEYISNPPDGTGRVKIVTKDGQPLYSLDRVQALVQDENLLLLWTRRCQGEVHKLFDSDLARVAELIQDLRMNGYIDSEWCENGSGAWAACDAYRIQRLETIPATGKLMTVEYFVKFAVGTTGQLLLLVSCHV